MTITVSDRKCREFNRKKALVYFERTRVELSQASKQPEKQVTNTAERPSYEKEK